MLLKDGKSGGWSCGVWSDEKWEKMGKNVKLLRK